MSLPELNFENLNAWIDEAHEALDARDVRIAELNEKLGDAPDADAHSEQLETLQSEITNLQKDMESVKTVHEEQLKSKDGQIADLEEKLTAFDKIFNQGRALTTESPSQ